MKIVAIKDMSAGNDCVGEAWQQTRVMNPRDTLFEVMKWAGTKKRVTLTIPDEDDAEFHEMKSESNFGRTIFDNTAGDGMDRLSILIFGTRFDRLSHDMKEKMMDSAVDIVELLYRGFHAAINRPKGVVPAGFEHLYIPEEYGEDEDIKSESSE
ncbi:MAG: hypothetical protein SVK08_01520 [Halobacteriota archaeon]|nr:hypothetical protein [Halobacteriota archaeon]